jgi:hypothetical protein
MFHDDRRGPDVYDDLRIGCRRYKGESEQCCHCEFLHDQLLQGFDGPDLFVLSGVLWVSTQRRGNSCAESGYLGVGPEFLVEAELRGQLEELPAAL